ncbi:MAG: DUF4391 domain-containing protein [Candidatus Accumulibacter sp.]|uniref:DUF4391 domain-containing protein n=1 Tax=Candidatus Accumulibacter affinis TaxID=2954384 RepID=A0A935TD21_9PROT|nr:DUF4391 domain-containing protein [Candidatus Accumulibacter affinis]
MNEPHRLASADLIAAFDLPAAALVNQRVPKKLLVENGAPTTADRKLIQERIEEITWVAALKPASIGVPEYRDEQRAYLELAVLLVDLREAGKVSRLAELIHRAIPYPVLLILADSDGLMLSLAHIRWAQKEADKTVLEAGYPQMAQIGADKGNPDFHLRESATSAEDAFLQALSLRNQPRADLHALYQGWLDTLTALQAAAITGCFAQSENAEQTTARRIALHRCREIDGEVARLRLAAAKEKQMARQVAVNMGIKALLAERERAATNL